MVEVNCNFKSGKSDLICRKCKIEEEDQRHLLVCPKLIEMALCCKTIDYEDLHGSDTSKLEIIGKVLMEKLHLLLSDNVNIITPLCTLFCWRENTDPTNSLRFFVFLSALIPEN